MTEPTRVDRLHQECYDQLQPRPAQKSARVRGLPAGVEELTGPVVLFFLTWYLIAGGLCFLGGRVVMRVGRFLGWPPDQTERELHELKKVVKELLDAVRAERPLDTKAAEAALERTKPGLEEATETLQGQIGPADEAAAQAKVHEMLQNLGIAEPMADDVARQIVVILAKHLGRVPGQQASATTAASGPKNG